jgi:hypothetical protein
MYRSLCTGDALALPFPVDLIKTKGVKRFQKYSTNSIKKKMIEGVRDGNP